VVRRAALAFLKIKIGIKIAITKIIPLTWYKYCNGKIYAKNPT